MYKYKHGIKLATYLLAILFLGLQEQIHFGADQIISLCPCGVVVLVSGCSDNKKPRRSDISSYWRNRLLQEQ